MPSHSFSDATCCSSKPAAESVLDHLGATRIDQTAGDELASRLDGCGDVVREPLEDVGGQVGRNQIKGLARGDGVLAHPRSRSAA